MIEYKGMILSELKEESQMAISEEEVKHVAQLSKLSFDESELHGFTESFGEILEMINQLDEVDGSNVEGMFRGTDVRNVMREDKSVSGTERELLFKNVKTTKDGFIQVPTIIDGGEDDA